jgi:hypothetical protein
MAPHLSRNLLRAVNAWQAGSVGKKGKAAKLKKVAEADKLEAYLRACDQDCYRRSVLTKAAVSELFFTFTIPEETSSWTTDAFVASRFKGGPPDSGFPPRQAGVIFRHRPTEDEVVLNLERLYKHEAFWPCVEHWEAAGADFTSGIRKYAGGQAEVILDVERVPHHEIHAFGGNAAEAWAKNGVGGLPVVGETAMTPGEIETSASDVGASPRRWLTDESVQTVYLNFIHGALKVAEARLGF